MKKYYRIDGRAANEYDLVYCETPDDYKSLPNGAYQITRKSAITLCSREASARKWDPNFSGYAPVVILPSALATGDTPNWYIIDNPHFFDLYIDGHIAERK